MGPLNDAVAVDEYAEGKHASVVAVLAAGYYYICLTDQDWIAYCHVGCEFTGPIRVIECYAYDFHTVTSIFLLKPGQHRHLFNAGRAPGGPEIDQPYLALKVAGGDRHSIDIAEREVRSPLTQQVIGR